MSLRNIPAEWASISDYTTCCAYGALSSTGTHVLTGPSKLRLSLPRCVFLFAEIRKPGLGDLSGCVSGGGNRARCQLLNHASNLRVLAMRGGISCWARPALPRAIHTLASYSPTSCQPGKDRKMFPICPQRRNHAAGHVRTVLRTDWPSPTRLEFPSSPQPRHHHAPQDAAWYASECWSTPPCPSG